MVKAWLMSLLMIAAFALIYWTGLFKILSYDWFFYIALGLVVVALAAAVIILGNPLAQEKGDEKDKD